MPQPRTSLKRSKKMIQITKYMKSLITMPMACDRNAARYSIAESRLAFHTALRNLSSFIFILLGRPFLLNHIGSPHDLSSVHRQIRHAAAIGKRKQKSQNHDPDHLKRHHADKQFGGRCNK